MLGDLLESALQGIGITPERIEQWLGVECHCEERKQKLNQLEAWMKMRVKMTAEKATHYIKQLLSVS